MSDVLPLQPGASAAEARPAVSSPAPALRVGRPWDPGPLLLIAAFWIAGPANWPLWRSWLQLPEAQGLRGFGQGLMLFALLAGLTALPLLLLSARRLLRPALALILVVCAVLAHYQGAYGVVIDVDMARNVMQTDWRETRDLLGLGLGLHLLLLAGLPLLLLRRWPGGPARGPLARLPRLRLLAGLLLVLAALLAANFGGYAAILRNHKALRYQASPLNAAWAFGLLAARSQAQPKGPPEPIALDVHSVLPERPARPPLLLLVLGETARADHFALNGYPRPTNPELSSRPVLSFQAVESCGTSTAASLPCMFSPWGRKGHDARLDSGRGESENLLDALQRAGLAVLWVDNQSGCKGLCERIPQARAELPASGAGPLPAGLCAEGRGCLDEALLHGLDERIAALDPARRARGIVLVLHMMGNHGPRYHARSPDALKRFQPECLSEMLADCPREQVVNAYDNALLETDRVLARATDWLESHSATHATSMLYLSDHGESLGENGLYLHGLPRAIAPASQTHVPMILWLDAARREAFGPQGCLGRQRDRALSHDLLFHTVYGLTGLRSREYRPELDLMQACASPGR